LQNLNEVQIKEAILEDLKNEVSIYFKGFQLVQKATFPIVFYEATPEAQPHQSNVGGANTDFPYLLAHSPATPLSRPEPLYNNKKGEWSFALVTKGNNSYATFSNTNISLDELVGLKAPDNNLIFDNSPFNNRANGVWQSRLLGQKSTVSFPHDAVIDFDVLEIVKNIKAGKIPVFVSESMGKVGLVFEEYNTTQADNKKRIFIQYETMLCSYLGNYGAGRTLNTFSLLPGEKTTITMRTYRDSIKANSLSENILDSMSEASSNSLQRAFESQKGSETGFDLNASSSNSYTQNKNWNVSGGGGLNLGIVSFGASGGGGGSSTTNNTSALSSSFHTKTIANIVNSGVNQHVSESNKHRDVNINSTTSNTESSGEENSIVRELHNVNLSRTLNFVFRQLHQEHIVIHWLKNIKFRFVDAATGENRLVFSHNLPTLLRDILTTEEAVNEVFNSIMSAVGIVFNYEDEPVQFFESRQFNTNPNNNNCDGVSLTPKSDCLWLRVKKLTDSYANITVNGVILGVQTHTLRTPSVIVDSLLGQGEALDCYNQLLQDHAVTAAELKNKQTQQSIEIIERLGDPIKQAELFNKVIGGCCDVPQSGCGCITCKDKE
jgi:hypothetical protein